MPSLDDSPLRPRKTKTCPDNGCCSKHGLNLRTQAIETTTHIGHPGGDPYLRSSAKIDHLRKLSMIERNSAASAPITAKPGNSMCYRTWYRLFLRPGISYLNDRLTRGRQCNRQQTWFALTPCARATSAVLAPGSNVSSAIRRFSDTVRQRRTGRTYPASGRHTPTTCGATTS